VAFTSSPKPEAAGTLTGLSSPESGGDYLSCVNREDEPEGRARFRPRVGLLGELALRVNDLEAMKAFYRDVVGLEVWRDGDGYVFFKVAEGVEGHPQAFVLFDRDVDVEPESSSLDHLAFVIDLDDYDARRRQLESLDLRVTPKEFPLFHWRALFVRDPEGNSVEFVCYDPGV
jgi:catechol-2,3-dioxygenase